MAVSVLNNMYLDEPHNICLQRRFCLQSCQADMFPSLSCGDDPGIKIKYEGNEYDDFFIYHATNSDDFSTCKDYVKDNPDYDYSREDPDRQWRVHTCFRSCKLQDDTEEFEIDERPDCTRNEDSFGMEYYEYDLLCVRPEDDCEIFKMEDEVCSDSNEDVCFSGALVWIAIIIANVGQLIFEAALLYTLNISFKPTELEKKMNPNKDETNYTGEDEEPPCDKVVKKCAGEMTVFITCAISIIILTSSMFAADTHGRPGTIWLEWFVAFVIDQVKSLMVQPLLWFLFVRRCGTLMANFEVWQDETMIVAMNDDSFLKEIRKSVNTFVESKPVTYFFIGLVLFYAVFILANLSLDTYTTGIKAAEDFFYYTDLCLLCFFLIEIILKSFAQGPEYYANNWNVIDTLVVVVSFAFSVMNMQIKGIGVLRLLRLIRVIIVMRRMSESKKKLMLLRRNNQGVSSNVPRVLDLLEEIRKDQSISRTTKQDLAWIVDLIQNKKIYITSQNDDEGIVISESVKIWRNMISKADEDLKGSGVGSAKEAGKEKQLRRARQSSADLKIFNSDYYTGMVNELFLTPIDESEALEREKLEQLEESIQGIDEWTWDLNRYYNLAGSHAFAFLGLRLFIGYDVMRACEDLSIDHWYNFLTKLSYGYAYKNHYHKEEHIIDTVQASHYFFTSGGLGSYLSIQDIVIGLTAAFIHDYEHPGLTNQFLIRTKHPKAIRYSDTSPLENHHIAAAYKLMKSGSDHDVFAYLDENSQRIVRKMLIQMVISTDLAYHFELISNVQSKIMSENFPQDNLEDRLTILTFTLHCADLSKAARPLNTYLSWSEFLINEFYVQGDMEKELGLPISPFNDRDNTNKERVQLSFIDYICKEPLEILNILSPAEKENRIKKDLIENGIEANRKNLQRKLEGDVKI